LRILDDDKTPRLTQPDRGSEAGAFYETLQRTLSKRLAAEPADVAPPRDEIG
jgi:hypothetical protein